MLYAGRQVRTEHDVLAFMISAAAMAATQHKTLPA